MSGGLAMTQRPVEAQGASESKISEDNPGAIASRRTERLVCDVISAWICRRVWHA
jgi:hypothetical protein